MGLVTLFLRPPESVLVPVLAQYQFDGDGVTLGLVTFSLRPLESVLVPVLVQYQSGGDGVTLDLVTLSLYAPLDQSRSPPVPLRRRPGIKQVLQRRFPLMIKL